MNEIRDKLKQLLNLLRSSNENYQANEVETALAGSDNDLKIYITSNELWGGAGSIADQALIENRESRRRVEAILAELGEIQMKAGIVNVRTEMWTSAFRQWQQQGI
jgi:hypothetical protein